MRKENLNASKQSALFQKDKKTEQKKQHENCFNSENEERHLKRRWLYAKLGHTSRFIDRKSLTFTCTRARRFRWWCCCQLFSFYSATQHPRTMCLCLSTSVERESEQTSEKVSLRWSQRKKKIKKRRIKNLTFFLLATQKQKNTRQPEDGGAGIDGENRKRKLCPNENLLKCNRFFEFVCE